RPEQSHAKVGQIVYVPIELLGENDIVESNVDRKLTVEVEGGELLAFGSANPCTAEQYHSGSFTTYYGRSLAVVRTCGRTTVIASDGVQSARAVIEVE
ncbi:MAG: beta-galactosidase, partial [Candidatus Fimadaptatus sp.]